MVVLCALGGLVVEREPVHGGEGAGGRAGEEGEEGSVLGRIGEVREGRRLGRMEEH